LLLFSRGGKKWTTLTEGSVNLGLGLLHPGEFFWYRGNNHGASAIVHGVKVEVAMLVHAGVDRRYIGGVEELEVVEYIHLHDLNRPRIILNEGVHHDPALVGLDESTNLLDGFHYQYILLA
jgi:hypothetical protein